MKQLLLYLPVLHRGYQDFLDRHADADRVLLLGAGFRAEYRALAKDLRALDPERAARYLRLDRPELAVEVIEPADLPGAVSAGTLVLPDEDVTRDLAARYDLARRAELTFEPTFLRWDRAWSQAGRPAGFDGEVTAAELPLALMARARELAGRSSDWWRQVGAIAVRGQEVLGQAWNQHQPTEYAPYLDGDPRDSFRRGVRADLSTAAHAEARVIAAAAREGVGLRGADLFVTTVPCPACARLIAGAGLGRCYVADAYSVLDGDAVLRAAGVELIWVRPDPA